MLPALKQRVQQLLGAACQVSQQQQFSAPCAAWLALPITCADLAASCAPQHCSRLEGARSCQVDHELQWTGLAPGLKQLAGVWVR